MVKITPSGGNVFRDLNVPNPNAHLFLADMMRHWNTTLTERIPDDIRELVERLK